MHIVMMCLSLNICRKANHFYDWGGCFTMTETKKGLFSDWKVHLLCIVLVIVAEFIGNKRFAFEIGSFPMSFTLLPMLYVLIIGLILGGFKLIDQESMKTASPYIGISVMWLIAKMGAQIGPNIEPVLAAGPILILQEIGNLGPVFFSMPVAVYVFKMGRQAVGASFSISREGGIAIIGSLYGLDSPEGQGVMGAYITGTVIGTIFNAIMASVLLATGVFSPEALGMAAGTGSASMMAAALAPVVEAFPHMADELSAYAAASQVLTAFDGLYINLFVALPVANWLYKVCGGAEKHAANEAKKAAKKARG
jgi:hypothetical protein